MNIRECMGWEVPVVHEDKDLADEKKAMTGLRAQLKNITVNVRSYKEKERLAKMAREEEAERQRVIDIQVKVQEVAGNLTQAQAEHAASVAASKRLHAEARSQGLSDLQMFRMNEERTKAEELRTRANRIADMAKMEAFKKQEQRERREEKKNRKLERAEEATKHA